MLNLVRLIEACAPSVGTITMLALIQTESGGNPLSIGDNTQKSRVIAQSLPDAISTAKDLLKKGHNLDLGLGQINSRNLPKLGISVEDIFDPCTNVRASATILKWGYQRAQAKTSDTQEALLQAISAYNTGSLSRGFQNGYVNNVLSQVGKPVIIPNLRPTKANVGRVSNAEGARGTVRLEFSELEYRGEKTEEVQSVKSTKGTSKRSDAINSSLAIKESQNEDNE